MLSFNAFENELNHEVEARSSVFRKRSNMRTENLFVTVKWYFMERTYPITLTTQITNLQMYGESTVK